MHDLNATMAVAAAVVIGLGLLSARIKTSLVSIPLIALLVGVAVGPHGLAWIDPSAWPHHHKILEEAARFTLAISVMGIAIRTPGSDYRRLFGPVALLLTLGMLGMWLASSVLAGWLLGLAPLAALLLGAIITPTDPVVASSIVTGAAAEKSLPDRLRSTLSLESGANDGLAYLFVLLPILLIEANVVVLDSPAATEAFHKWLIEVVLIGVLLAVAIGAALGALAGFALRSADRLQLMEKHSFLSLTVALSLLAVSAAKLVGSDGILAAFAAGIALQLTVDRQEDAAEENVQEAISKLFNLPIFVLLGLSLPFAGWHELGLTGLAFALLVLLLRRPPVLLILWPALRRFTRPEFAFLAWFGPVGVAAIYYSMVSLEHTGDDVLWHGASLVISMSILVHGITASPFMRLFVREEP